MFPRCFLVFVFSFLGSAQSVSPFRFIAVGDTGSGSAPQGRVAEQMWKWREKNSFNLILMLGDNIYGEHEFIGGGDPRFFPEKFDAFYQRFLEQGVVFHAAIGNHDMQTNHGQAEIDDRKRFGILGSDGYYRFAAPTSFNAGARPLVDFFALNSELKNGKMAQQVAWLQQELKKSDAVWKIVFLHEPLYSVSGQHAPDIGLRQLVQNSLKQNHVQFILAGHNHFYARMKPVDQAMQLISGGGGRHLGFPRSDHCADIAASKYHFLGVEVYPEKVRFVATDQYGVVFDDKIVDADYLKSQTKGCPER